MYFLEQDERDVRSLGGLSHEVDPLLLTKYTGD